MNNALEKIKAHCPRGITGKNIGVAILDTGICPLEDFTIPNNRIVAFKDFLYNNPVSYDDNGHGTHVAGIAAGNGYLSNGKFHGVATEANIISLKILDEFGHGTASSAMLALQWIEKYKEEYNIKVVNLSIGTSDRSIAPLLTNAVNNLWSDGIVVVAAAGNDETEGITAPGISPKIITVGSIDDNVQFKIRRGNSVYYKPDIFAPGNNIISCKATDFSFYGKKRSIENVVANNYVKMSGSSMATPMVSGTAALILQYAPNISPDTVKDLICNNASAPNPKGFLNIEKIFREL